MPPEKYHRRARILPRSAPARRRRPGATKLGATKLGATLRVRGACESGLKPRLKAGCCAPRAWGMRKDQTMEIIRIMLRPARVGHALQTAKKIGQIWAVLHATFRVAVTVAPRPRRPRGHHSRPLTQLGCRAARPGRPRARGVYSPH